MSACKAAQREWTGTCVKRSILGIILYCIGLMCVVVPFVLQLVIKDILMLFPLCRCNCSVPRMMCGCVCKLWCRAQQGRADSRWAARARWICGNGEEGWICYQRAVRWRCSRSGWTWDRWVQVHQLKCARMWICDSFEDYCTVGIGNLWSGSAFKHAGVSSLEFCTVQHVNIKLNCASLVTMWDLFVKHLTVKQWKVGENFCIVDSIWNRYEC
jgi:hypothetical protein